MPNPFNPAPLLSFRLESPQQVTLQVFDRRGRLVQTLLDDVAVDAGLHEVPWRPHDVASGVCAVRVRAGAQEQRGRVTLLK